MKIRIWISLLALSISATAVAQTSRQYFKELRNKNAFDHYSDEYVCFPDTDDGGFAVIAKTADIEKVMAANGATGAKPQKPLGKYLIVQTYYKGVGSSAMWFKKIHEDSDEAWSLDYRSPMHGKNVYLVNWTTGRYRFLVYDLDASGVVPAAETDGKCELIHPWAPPPGKQAHGGRPAQQGAPADRPTAAQSAGG